MSEMKINNIDIAHYGARLYSFSEGGTSFTREKASINLACLPPILSTTFGCKKLSVTLTFTPNFTQRLSYSASQKQKIQAVSKQKSELEYIMLNSSTPIEIQMPDGFLYLAYLIQIGDTEYETEIETEYTFDAIKCLNPITHTFSNLSTGDTVNFKSLTQLETYCVLTLTPKNVGVGSVILSTIGKIGFTVTNGIIHPICIDGINKTVKTIDDGQKAMSLSTFTDFPTVHAGTNSISISGSIPTSGIVLEELKIKYYPTFV